MTEQHKRRQWDEERRKRCEEENRCRSEEAVMVMHKNAEETTALAAISIRTPSRAFAAVMSAASAFSLVVVYAIGSSL